MSTKRKLAFAIPVIAFVVFPSVLLVALASTTNNVWDVSILAGPLVTCTGTGGGVPACQSLCDLVATVIHVVYFGIAVVIWIVTPIMFALSGIRFMMAGANPAQPTKEDPGARAKAKKMLTGTVIGLVIVLCAYLIVFTFVTVLNISGVGGFSASTCTVQPASGGSTGTGGSATGGGTGTGGGATGGGSYNLGLPSGATCQQDADCQSNDCLQSPIGGAGTCQ
jgi:Type IV secretion system pilin